MIGRRNDKRRSDEWLSSHPWVARTGRGAEEEDGPPIEAENRTPAVKIWGGLGIALALFIAYVMISWITGPYWKEVPAARATPPG